MNVIESWAFFFTPSRREFSAHRLCVCQRSRLEVVRAVNLLELCASWPQYFVLRRESSQCA